jgi:hypothetical protein
VDLSAQAMGGPEGLGLPARERGPVEAGEVHAVLDAAVLLGRADGTKKGVALGQMGPERRDGAALRLHHAQQAMQQLAGHALPAVRAQHAAPDVDERREGRVVGRALAAIAHVQAPEEPAMRIVCQQALDVVQGPVPLLLHVAPDLGVARLRLVGNVFFVAQAPVGKDVAHCASDARCGIENGSGNAVCRDRAARVSSMVSQP